MHAGAIIPLRTEYSNAHSLSNFFVAGLRVAKTVLWLLCWLKTGEKGQEDRRTENCASLCIYQARIELCTTFFFKLS